MDWGCYKKSTHKFSHLHFIVLSEVFTSTLQKHDCKDTRINCFKDNTINYTIILGWGMVPMDIFKLSDYMTTEKTVVTKEKIL